MIFKKYFTKLILKITTKHWLVQVYKDKKVSFGVANTKLKVKSYEHKKYILITE